MQFVFFYFEPLKYEDFVNQIDQSSYKANALRSSHLAWTIEFCRKSLLFYQHQYRAHSDIVWSEFCSTYEIPAYEHPSNFGLDAEWKNWKEEYLLDSHYGKHQEVIQALTYLQDTTNREIKSNPTIPIELSATKISW
jgi:hypothetical protein